MADWSRTTALALLLAAGLSLPTSPAATTTQKADEIKPAQADGVFASTINTMDIFTLENDFIEKLNALVESERSQLAKLEKIARDVNAEYTQRRNVTEASFEVKDGFALVRRLQNSTATVEAQLYGSTPAAWTNMSAWFRKNGKRVPTEQDLIGARDAVLRSQRTYNISAAEFMPDEPASVFIDIGARAAGQHDWHTALDWFQLAAAKLADRPLDWFLNEADNATRAKFISLHDHLAFAAYRVGDLDLAIEASYTVLDVDPDNFRVQDNVEWYEYELEQMPTVAAPLPGTKKKTAAASCPMSRAGMRYAPVDSVPGEARTVAAREQDCADRCSRVTGCAYWSWWTDGGCHLSGESVQMVQDDAVVSGYSCQGANATWTAEDDSRPPVVEPDEGVAMRTNFSADNILSHPDEIMSSYRHLCQTAKQHIATSSRLTCKVADRGHPQLLLQPANIETIMLGDDANITVFRDFLTDSEREHLIATARGELERSVASVGSEYAPVEFRVSSVAWLKPNRTTMIEQIHRRIEAATGLDLYSAEELQVCNYGIGGHYEPHFDASTKQDQKPTWKGLRLATFMMYLSDVAQGGATVFPKIGISLRPRKNDAIFWYNIRPDGMDLNRQTLHAGCPVTTGSKWVANKWIHEAGNAKCMRP